MTVRPEDLDRAPITTSAESILTGVIGMLSGMGLSIEQIRTAFRQVGECQAIWDTFDIFAVSATELARDAALEVSERDAARDAFEKTIAEQLS